MESALIFNRISCSVDFLIYRKSWIFSIAEARWFHWSGVGQSVGSPSPLVNVHPWSLEYVYIQFLSTTCEKGWRCFSFWFTIYYKLGSLSHCGMKRGFSSQSPTFWSINVLIKVNIRGEDK